MLEDRTEGWIAALQLAGLTLQGRDDVAGFIADFAGDDRYIVDYLVEEVRHAQPDDIRSFLSQTAILARMCGSLCDAVTGQDGGKATLEALDRRNLFLIALDDRRRWYRYHHLFADVLRARLLDEQPDLVPALHRRAAEWYAQEGEPDEAIRHAIAGEDFGLAANLVELATPTMGRDRRESTMRRWLEAIPEATIRARPVLSDGVAGSLLVRGETDGVEARLADAERWLDLTAESLASEGKRPPGMVVSDEVAFRRLPASIAIHRAGLARSLGDDVATVTHARRALELVDEDEHLGRGARRGAPGTAEWAVGDLTGAERSYIAAVASLERAGHLSDTLGLTLALADIRIAQGRLDDAKRAYEQGLQLSIGHGGPALRGTADMHVGLSAIACERNDLTSALEHLRASAELGEDNGLPQNPYRSKVALARVRQAEGDPRGRHRPARGGCTDLLRRLLAGRPPDRGDQGTAAEPRGSRRRSAGVGERSGPVDRGCRDVPAGVRARHPRAGLGRASVARPRRCREFRDVLGFLARLLAAAEAGGRIGGVIDILLAQALAQQACGESSAATTSLARAVETWQRPRDMSASSWTRVRRSRPSRDWRPSAGTDRLHLRRLQTATIAPAGRTSGTQSLIEPLSERELEVLRLLATDLFRAGYRQ